MYSYSSERGGGVLHRVLLALVALIGVYLVVFGAWAFLLPDSFWRVIVLIPAYNHHLVHDAGAFQAGLGAALLLPLWPALRGGLLVAILANLVQTALHTVSHLEDLSLGGSPGAVAFLGAQAVVLLAAAVAEVRWGRT